MSDGAMLSTDLRSAFVEIASTSAEDVVAAADQCAEEGADIIIGPVGVPRKVAAAFTGSSSGALVLCTRDLNADLACQLISCLAIACSRLTGTRMLRYAGTPIVSHTSAVHGSANVGHSATTMAVAAAQVLTKLGARQVSSMDLHRLSKVAREKGHDCPSEQRACDTLQVAVLADSCGDFDLASYMEVRAAHAIA